VSIALPGAIALPSADWVAERQFNRQSQNLNRQSPIANRQSQNLNSEIGNLQSIAARIPRSR